MPTFAAVDIGSNSVRLKIARLTRGHLRPIHEDREVTRLGEGVFRSGFLTPESMAETVKVLRRFHRATQQVVTESVRVVATSGDDDLFEVTSNGMTIRFSENDVRPMGRDAAGVRGVRLREEDVVVSLDVARDEADILMVTDAGYGKRTKLERFNRQARGGQGVRGIRLTAKRGRVVAAFMVSLDEEILLVSTGGVVIRTAVREIASQGRDATGVRVMNLDDGQAVAAVAPVSGSE